MRRLVLSAVVLSVSAGCMGVSDPALVTVLLSAPPTPSLDGGSPVAADAGPDAGAAFDAGTPAVDGGVSSDGGVDPCAGITCGAGARCEPSNRMCVCLPGYVQGTSGCEPIMPGSPATRSQTEVCSAWATANQQRASGDGFSMSANTCDPGTVSREALDDGLARLNFFRWLVGLAPTTDSATDNDAAQKCSLVSAWNPAGPSAHYPTSSATCYTPEGASGAGSSNIAWGASSAANAIDLWMIDFGNETTFGHRRWLLNPPLNPVGIGHYRGGNNYGSASCIRVFGGSGTGPTPNWLAFPPPGFVPEPLAQWHWTVHGNIPLNNATATVTRLSDGANLPVTLNILSGFYGQAAASIVRDGWSPAAGETYHVTVSGQGGAGTIEYDVKPVGCP
ncbi:MAG: CAP domain-containing protein [Myxococcota bacterium]